MEMDLKEIKKPRSSGKAEVKDLVNTLKGTLVTDTDKMGYINFRYPGSKTIIFYCIGRKNFVTVSTKNDSAKSGWESQRLYTKADVKTFVESIKEQIDGGN